jgi:hypothetical protein
MEPLSKIIDAEDILAYARDCIDCASSACAHVFGKEGDQVATVIDIAGEKIDGGKSLVGRIPRRSAERRDRGGIRRETNPMKRISIAAIAATMIATPANATMTAACRTALTRAAVEYHGAEKCDRSWMHRAPFKFNQAKALFECKGATPDETTGVVNMAFATFDGADAGGHAAACKLVDDGTAETKRGQ